MSPSRFTQRTVALLSVLLLIAGGLAAANVLQVPRITAVEVRPAALTETDGARITVRFSQPVGAIAPEDIRIDPDVPISARTDGSAVTITLGARLNYAQSLRLALRVSSAATGVSGEASTRVDAPDARVTTLVRAEHSGAASDGVPGGQDRLVADALVHGGRPTEFFPEAPVREYALLPDRIVVLHDASALDSRTPVLGTYAVAGGSVHPVIQDSSVDLSHLRADPRALSYGVIASGLIVDGQRTENALLVFDAQAEAGAPRVIADETGLPIRVAVWSYGPGSGELVIRDTEGQSWHGHTLLGPASRIAPDDPLTLALPRADGTVTVAEGAQLRPSPDGRSVLRRTASGEHVWFSPAGGGSRVGALCVAPNQRVVAVEVTAVAGRPDGRAGVPGMTHTTTQFLDVASGTLLRSLIGFAPNWC